MRVYVYIYIFSSTAGYGGLLLGLSVEEGDIRALFVDISANYHHFETLDNYGPTLVYSDSPTELTDVVLGERV